MNEEQKNLYLDPRWQKYRLNRLRKADWKCENCGNADSTLHVHHTFYKPGRKPWQYPFNTTKVLCDACHKSEHSLTEDDELREAIRKANDMNWTYHAKAEREAHPERPVEMEEWIFYEDGKQINVQRPASLF